VKALEWIQENIANFGGDPERVTIGGQSAGSAATQQLLYSPLSQGLFSSAIIESGVHDPYDPTTATVASTYLPSLEFAEAGGLSVVQNLSTITSLSALRNISTATLIEAQNNYTSYDGQKLWAINLDGYVIKYTYDEGLQNSSLADVPILTGNTKDENGVTLSGVSLATYQEYVTSNYGNLSSKVYALYLASNNSSATTAYNTLIRDNTKVTTYLWSKLWNANR
jgi:carboxylesterase type B